MPAGIVITEDYLTWYGPEDLPPGGQICLVRFRTGELNLVANNDVPQLSNLWMWAVIPPPPQFILEKETI